MAALIDQIECTECVKVCFVEKGTKSLEYVIRKIRVFYHIAG